MLLDSRFEREGAGQQKGWKHPPTHVLGEGGCGGAFKRRYNLNTIKIAG